MKKLKRLTLSLVLLVILLLPVSIKAKAYNIDNELSTIPAGYYDSLDTTLLNEDFRRDLSAIISKGYKRYPYSGSGIDVHEILKVSDEAPIANQVECIYSGRYMQFSQTGVIPWDKEHVWAKSHGFPENPYGNEAVFSDAHNLRPALASINRSRSNRDFGVVDNPTKVMDDCKQDDTTFEPRDESKGDIARIMFYMATRYGFDQFNLTLVNDKKTESSSLNGRFGNLDTLIKWHYMDPVSISEIYRNNVVYGYQNNRNPYIDHPEYVSLAYPNSYDDLSVNENSVKTIINAISLLPKEITLNDKVTVNNIYNEFNKLNTTERGKITNYLVLDKAKAKIEMLEYQSRAEDTPVAPAEGISYKYEFTSNMFKANNETLALNGLPWTLSLTGGKVANYDANRGLHLGVNNNPCSNVFLSTNSVGKVNKVIINASGNSGVNASLSVSVGNTTAQAVKLTNNPLYYSFDFNDVSGPIKINIDNSSKKGLYIKSIEIHYQNEAMDRGFIDEFINTECKASLRITYDEVSKIPSDVDLRIGGMILKSSFNENAKYGVVVAENGTKLTSGLQNLATAKEKFDDQAIEIKPVRVDSSGNEDINGDYYQFSLVITNMEGHYSYLFTTAIYMEYDNKLYLSKIDNESVLTVKEKYISLNNVSAEIIEVLKNIV